MFDATKIRWNVRRRTQLEAHYCSDRQEGGGALANISYSGALIEDTSSQPSVGADVIVYVTLPDKYKPFEIHGNVVRHTERGFAVGFGKIDPNVRDWIDSIDELMKTPEGSVADRTKLPKESSPDPIATESAKDEPSITPTRRPELPCLRELVVSEYTTLELKALTERIAAEIARRSGDGKQRLRGEIAQLAERNGFTLEEVIGILVQDRREDQETAG